MVLCTGLLSEIERSEDISRHRATSHGYIGPNRLYRADLAAIMEIITSLTTFSYTA